MVMKVWTELLSAYNADAGSTPVRFTIVFVVNPTPGLQHRTCTRSSWTYREPRELLQGRRVEAQGPSAR